MENDKKEVIAKVRKLFALANDKANEHEAQKALTIAHAHMKKYGIEMLELEGEENLKLEAEVWESELLGQVDSFGKILADAVAKLFDCEWWMWRPGKRLGYKVKMCFAGGAVDVAMAREAWVWLLKMARSLAIRSMGKGWSPSHRSFAEGFGFRIKERCIAMVNADAASVEDEDQKYGLVLLKKQNAIEKLFKKEKIEIKLKQSPLKGDVDKFAMFAGAKAGDKVALSFKNKLAGDSPSQ